MSDSDLLGFTRVTTHEPSVQWGTMQPNRIEIAWPLQDVACAMSAGTGHPLLHREIEVYTTVETTVRCVPLGPWEPVISDAEQAKTAEYRTIIEQAMEGK